MANGDPCPIPIPPSKAPISGRRDRDPTQDEDTMKSTHGRKIHPFRMSGHNPRPQPPQAGPSPSDDWDEPQGLMVSMGSQNAAQQRVRARVAAMSGLGYVDPPRVPVGTAVVGVNIDGARVRLPADWELAITSKNNRDVLLAREPNGVLHLLLLDANGKLRELTGVPDDLMRDIAAWKFPGGSR